MMFLKGQFPEDVAEEGRSNAKGRFHLANQGLCRNIVIVIIAWSLCLTVMQAFPVGTQVRLSNV